MIKLAVCIVHAAHIPARVERMQRLRSALGVASDLHDDTARPTPFNVAALQHVDDRIVAYHEETTRGRYIAWHELSLRFFLNARDAFGATHALTLQDDVIPSAQFWKHLFAMLEGRPNEVICLDCAHPAARLVFAEGLPGYTTPDGLIGIGHVEPMSVVADFAKWRVDEVREGMIERITEDSLFGMFCMHRELPIFAPVPCIIDHELEIESTNTGFDNAELHWYRKPQVTTRDLERLDNATRAALEENMLDPAWWANDEIHATPHIGRFYENAHEFLPLVLPCDVTALLTKYTLDKTPKKYERFWQRIGTT